MLAPFRACPRSGVLATLRARALLEDVEQRVAERKAENEKLREEIRQLREDRQAVEKVAREELLMIRPDEVLLVLPDVEAGSGEAPPEPRQGSPPKAEAEP